MSTNMKSISENTNPKESMVWTIVLIAFGIAAIYGGAKWLGVLVPAAALIWFGTRQRIQTGGN
jgi:hypothetical protein